MQGERRAYKGSCHGGAVKFEAQSTLSPALRCHCSLCRRKGTVMAVVQPEHFRLLSGDDALVLEVGLHDGASL